MLAHVLIALREVRDAQRLLVWQGPTATFLSKKPLISGLLRALLPDASSKNSLAQLTHHNIAFGLSLLLTPDDIFKLCLSLHLFSLQLEVPLVLGCLGMLVQLRLMLKWMKYAFFREKSKFMQKHMFYAFA